MKTFLGFAVVILFSSIAIAQEEVGTSRTLTEPRFAGYEEQRPSLGLLAGFSDPEGVRDSTTTYGVEFGFQPIVPMSAAVELSSFSSPSEGSTPSMTRTKLMGKWNYNLGGNIPVLKFSYAGIGLGAVYDNVAHDSTLAAGIAPQVGFDIPLSGSLVSSLITLGLNANYLFVTEGKPDTFALNGVAKYWY